MATRYEVRWMETGDVWHKRGFAFMTGAIALFERLCQNERDGGGVTCPLVEHLGPNGERAEYPVAVSDPGKLLTPQVRQFLSECGREGGLA